MVDFLGQSEAVGAWNLNRGTSEAVMDYSSSAYVEISLDLNSKPLRLLDDTPAGFKARFFTNTLFPRICPEPV